MNFFEKKNIFVNSSGFRNFLKYRSSLNSLFQTTFEWGCVCFVEKRIQPNWRKKHFKKCSSNWKSIVNSTNLSNHQFIKSQNFNFSILNRSGWSISLNSKLFFWKIQWFECLLVVDGASHLPIIGQFTKKQKNLKALKITVFQKKKNYSRQSRNGHIWRR